MKKMDFFPPDCHNDLNRRKISDILAQWSRCPNPKIGKTDSKIYARTEQALLDLSRGVLFSKKQFDKLWLVKKEIPRYLLLHKWTEEEIQDIYGRLVLLYDPKYLPVKKYLPVYLGDLIWDSLKRKSWFLEVWVHPPKKLEDVVIDIPIKNLAFLEELQNWFDLSQPKDKALAIGIANQLEDLYNELPSDAREGRFWLKMNLFELFRNRLQGLPFYRDLQLSALRPDGKLWQQFRKYVLAQYGD